MSFFSPHLRISFLPSSPMAWLGWFGFCDGPGVLVFGIPLGLQARSCFVLSPLNVWISEGRAPSRGGTTQTSAASSASKTQNSPFFSQNQQFSHSCVRTFPLLERLRKEKTFLNFYSLQPKPLWESNPKKSQYFYYAEF